MKKPAVLFLVVVISVLSYSCRKASMNAEMNLSEKPDYSNYMPLKPGNYWIYDIFDIDTNGVETLRPRPDSMFIQTGPVIRGHQYYNTKSYELPFTNSTLRDSSDYIINEAGKVMFCAMDFTTIFGTTYITNQSVEDTMYKFIFKMDDKGTLITTPAGTFTTITAKTTTTIYPKYTHTGLHNPKYSVSMYSKNVGIVYDKYEYASLNAYFGRKLRRYRVQ